MKVGRRYFNFNSQIINYTITSLGHEVGLKTEYPKSSLKKYEIKLQKSKDKVMKSKHKAYIATKRGSSDLPAVGRC